LTISDVDTGEAKFDPASVLDTTAGGALGSLTITEAGVWTYTVDNAAVQYLGAGKTKVETFTVKSLDGTGTQTISVTINGTNDVPVFSGADTGSVKEDAFDGGGLIKAWGVLSVVDADAGESKFNAGTVNGAYGSLYIYETSGYWVYTLNNSLSAVQELGEGDSLTDTVTDHGHQ
jgi:large repetitive protein